MTDEQQTKLVENLNELFESQKHINVVYITDDGNYHLSAYERKDADGKGTLYVSGGLVHHAAYPPEASIGPKAVIGVVKRKDLEKYVEGLKKDALVQDLSKDPKDLDEKKIDEEVADLKSEGPVDETKLEETETTKTEIETTPEETVQDKPASGEPELV